MTRKEIKKEILYRHNTLREFSESTKPVLNYRLVSDFFRGLNNNQRIIATLEKEGFKKIPLIGVNASRKVAA